MAKNIAVYSILMILLNVKNISFSDLSDIVAAYPYTMEKGLIFICDKDAVEELGLSEEYEKIYTKEKIEEISKLSTDLDVDFFVNMGYNKNSLMCKGAFHV